MRIVSAGSLLLLSLVAAGLRTPLLQTMGRPGLSSARVDAAGRYRIGLMPGRYAVIPAPGARDVVVVAPRWVRVGPG